MTVNLNAYSIAGLINKLLSNQLMTAKDTGHHKNQNDIPNNQQLKNQNHHNKRYHIRPNYLRQQNSHYY